MHRVARLHVADIQLHVGLAQVLGASALNFDDELGRRAEARRGVRSATHVGVREDARCAWPDGGGDAVPFCFGSFVESSLFAPGAAFRNVSGDSTI